MMWDKSLPHFFVPVRTQLEGIEMALTENEKDYQDCRKYLNHDKSYVTFTWLESTNRELTKLTIKTNYMIQRQGE